MSFSEKSISVGVDIGSSSIKLVGLFKKKIKKKIKILFAVQPIPQKSEPAQISELIREACEKIGVSVSRVSISVSGPEVIFKYLQLPVIRKREIFTTIRLEWDKYVSFKLDEVAWDIQILPALRSRLVKKRMSVLLVLAKKELINRKVTLLNGAKLEPKTIGTDISCLVNAFCFLYPKKVKNSRIALLNMGDSYSNLAVLEKGIPKFSRDIPLGGRDITQGISQKKRINFSEAEKIKLNFDENDKEAFSVVKMWTGDIASELNFSFEYLKEELGEKVRTVYISGGSSRLFKLKESLTRNLGIKVEDWQLKPDLKNSMFDLDIESYFPELIVGLGLALNE